MTSFRSKTILVFNILTVFLLGTVTAKAQHYDGQYHSVDLRDHIQFGSYNDLPTHTIQTAIENRVCHFTANIDPLTNKPDERDCDFNYRRLSNPNMKFTREGAIGPRGTINGEVFVPTDKRMSSRTDTIFSVEFDGENSVKKMAEGLYMAKIILFIHDSQRSSTESEQYFFRKMTVKTDSSYPITDPQRVIITHVEKDIPLSDTYFEVYTDIAERKTVLIDNYNKIRKVFPVGVGAFDVRTLPGMDNFIGSMTEELKKEAIITARPGVNDNGKPIEVQILQERNHPSWYKGRPFIGILDENGTKYKEIGFHYQIDDDQLRRAFVSHGCIRVRDKDLYQLSVIVFKGTQEKVPVQVVNSFSIYNHLQSLTSLDHPYPKTNNSFKRIIYADKNYASQEARAQVSPSIISIAKASDFTEVERFEWCRQNGKYDVLRYHGPWASVLGTDCLTRITTENRHVGEFITYMLGYTNTPPVIAAHKTETQSKYNPSQPVQADVSFICFLSLADAAKHFPQHTGRTLSYNEFAQICGCQRLADELRSGKYKNGVDTYRKICQ